MCALQGNRRATDTTLPGKRLCSAATCATPHSPRDENPGSVPLGTQATEAAALAPAILD